MWDQVTPLVQVNGRGASQRPRLAALAASRIADFVGPTSTGREAAMAAPVQASDGPILDATYCGRHYVRLPWQARAILFAPRLL